MKLLKGILAIGLFSVVSICLVSCVDSANATNTSPSKTSTKEASTLEWHDIHDLASLQKNGSKKVIVDVYTDWCKWCKVMDQKTFTDPSLIQYLNQNYHMVKFDAETKSSLTFKGKSYDFIANGRRGYNKLAQELCQGRLSYPSFVVLDTELNTIQVVNGFKDAKSFRSILDKIDS